MIGGFGFMNPERSIAVVSCARQRDKKTEGK